MSTIVQLKPKRWKAYQFLGGLYSDMDGGPWIPSDAPTWVIEVIHKGGIRVVGEEGKMPHLIVRVGAGGWERRVEIDDWIIQVELGLLDTVSAAVFAETYEVT